MTPLTDSRKTIAAIGCSGQVADVFVRGLLAEGVSVRLLARDAETLGRRYPAATVISGSMMNADDVARAVEGADAAFFLTPIAKQNDPSTEFEAADAVIAGARAGQLKHLIYTSALGAGRNTGVGVLDAKYEVERLLEGGGTPYSVLRCGSYMEDVFDPRLNLLNKGRFLLPINKSRRISYVSQKDVAPFVVQELVGKARVVNGVIDFVEPRSYAVSEVEQLLTTAAGRTVTASPRFPTYYLFSAALPYFRWRGHRFSSIIPLVRYWDSHGSVASENTVGAYAPSFRMTTLEEHLTKLFQQRQ
ncbi:SDR family oxidoreductase [Nocardia salmonicida]|uniref:SDR family oxidoreductase n=1 Tax=Nocardia salmonicida TaxID=53431 RepID=UPI002E2A9194|nr:NAD(P)H-binding protein [Nocardia salmonicida]